MTRAYQGAALKKQRAAPTLSREERERRTFIEYAREEYARGSSDTIEVDDDAQTSPAPDGSGTWVQAWVWIDTSEDT